MPDILHKVRVNDATKDDAYKALTTNEGLAGWWTRDTTGVDMEVLELDPGKRVRWLVVDGPQEWIGTRIDWELREDEHGTVVLFKHQDWKEPVEFMHHCSTKWAMFLMSLKALIEGGEGAPWPQDVKVDGFH